MWQIIPRTMHGIPVAIIIVGPARKSDVANHGWQVVRLHIPLYGWYWLVDRYVRWRHKV